MAGSKARILAGTLLVLAVLTLVCWPAAAQSYLDEPGSAASSVIQGSDGGYARGIAPGEKATEQSIGTSSSEGIDSVLGGRAPSSLDFSYTSGMQVAGIRAAGTLPATYDLRALGRVTSVKDQGSHGTCWAFAAVGSLESCLLTGEDWDFSEDNMVLAGGFDDQNGATDGPYFGGNTLLATAYLAGWGRGVDPCTAYSASPGGPVTETQDAYGDSSTPPGLTASKHVQEVNWIPLRSSASDNDNIKNAVMDYGAVDVGMYINSSSSSYYNSATHSYYYNGVLYANHDVLVVGWDDDYAAANFAITPAGNGAFIVKNSYGTLWGDNGYFYVSYYDSRLGRPIPSSTLFNDPPIAVFDNAESPGNYSGMYQYDPLGCIGNTYAGFSASTTGWFANVFTAEATASLSAVGFYTLAANSTYEVYTGTSITGTTLNGKTLQASGTIPYLGFHTVPLPSPVPITNGQQFVVAVKMTTPGYTNPIAFEYPRTNFSSAATAQAGQSYDSTNGTSWKDFTTYGVSYANANVCLKAYVNPLVADTPTITGLEPTSGPATGGTSVIITGTDFVGIAGPTLDPDAVTFGGTNATTYTVDSSTQITATAPAHTSGTVQVQVTAFGGPSANTAADDFTYIAAPTISALEPTSGPATGGTSVIISGTDFVGIGGPTLDPDAVTFGGTNATTYTVDSPTQITATAPAHGSGTVDVQVTAAGGLSDTGGAADDYTYYQTYTLTYSHGANGSITGTTPQTVNHGASGTAVTAVPDTGYHFVNWSDGYPTAARTDTNVTADITVSATFAINAATYSSYKGTDRFDTAIRVSQASYPAPLPAGSGVVLAPGWESYQEALCGSPLAAAWGGPVLLSSKTVLYGNVSTELQRLAPARVFCIGLTAGLADAVRAALPSATVTSINGTGTTANIVYDMSYQVAKALGSKVGDMSAATAIVTTGTNFPDAIGVSPLACAKLWPILLTNNAQPALNAKSAQAISELGITQALKVGTYATLPVGVAGVGNCSGADRYYTNASVAIWGQTYGGLTYAHTGITTGDKFPDALAAGPYLAKDNGTLLLSPLLGPLPPAIAAVLTTNRAEVQLLTFVACVEPVIGQVKALLP